MAHRPQHPNRPLRQRHRWAWPKVTRDGGLYLLGVGGILHEIVVRDGELPERFYILAACLALVGLPSILRLDERRRESEDQ